MVEKNGRQLYMYTGELVFVINANRSFDLPLTYSREGNPCPHILQKEMVRDCGLLVMDTVITSPQPFIISNCSAQRPSIHSLFIAFGFIASARVTRGKAIFLMRSMAFEWILAKQHKIKHKFQPADGQKFLGQAALLYGGGPVNIEKDCLLLS